jgi:GT2 family glycosyltransferase
MNRPVVTIVIPCYNDADYLLEAIDSAKRQTYEACNIVVVDDASDDAKTREILDTLEKDDTLKLVRLERNGGPAAARNRGIAADEGTYVLPLDADDVIAPTYVEKAVNVLQKRPETGIVYCKARLFGAKNEPWELPEFAFPEILTENMIFATAMFRRSDWEKVGGYDENLRDGNEDYDFWLSLLELGVDVYRIPETLFYYRIKSESRTSRLHANEEKEIDTYVHIFRRHRDLYLDNVRIFFETLHRRKRKLLEKDDEIRKLHARLKFKDKEIKRLHGNLKHLTEKLDETGAMLTYAQELVAYRDKQLEAARLKNRMKRFLSRFLPFVKSTPLPPPPQLPEICRANTPPSAYRYRTPVLSDTVKKEIAAFAKRPRISVLMPVYNVDPKWLDKAVESVRAQWYDNWELCIVDDKSTNPDTLAYLKSLNDARIKVRFGEVNKNIAGASNDAAAMATGEYLLLLDNDDELTPDALYEVVKAVNETGAEFIYSDEDFIDTEGNCSNPHFKPDFSPDLLMSHNYITHIACFTHELFKEVGGFDERFSGSQDYDLFLKLTEKTDRIVHIPKVLYHWRTIEGSTSADSKAKPEALEISKRVLEETLERRGIDGYVEPANIDHYFRVRYTIKNEPLVSIVIPFKDKPELLEMCVTSILEKSTYRNFEIIGISNNSEEQRTFDTMKKLEAADSRVSFYEYNVPFNYAQINNHAVHTYARGDHILLLNNDIETITPDWIEAMLEHSQRPEIGCVGAKLYYPDDTIQHAGIIIGLGGYAGHSHKHYPKESWGYFNRLNAIQNVSAVTAACLMVEKRIYVEIGGMDEEKFKIAYNDVDFCLRVLEAGYRNIFTPYAELYHHESVSRGYETTPEKIARFEKEKEALMERHYDILINGDPYYNPNLTHDKEDFSLCPQN